jgi:hypothetical protein
MYGWIVLFVWGLDTLIDVVKNENTFLNDSNTWESAANHTDMAVDPMTINYRRRFDSMTIWRIIINTYSLTRGIIYGQFLCFKLWSF